MKEKAYITAQEISEHLGISVGFAYRLIREMNQELKKQGYLTVAGKVSAQYFNEKWYGLSDVSKAVASVVQ